MVTPSAYEEVEARSSTASKPTGQVEDFDPGAGAHLIWCPTNGRYRIADFIDGALHTLFLQNERYQDPVINERLVREAPRGRRCT